MHTLKLTRFLCYLFLLTSVICIIKRGLFITSCHRFNTSIISMHKHCFKELHNSLVTIGQFI